MFSLVAASLAMALVAADPLCEGGDHTGRFISLLSRGRVDQARRCLAKNPRLAWAEHSQVNLTVLHYAAQLGDAELARFVMRRGVSATTSNLFEVTPLHLARTPEVARLLIANGADINATDMDGRTPLNMAAEQGGNILLSDHDSYRRVARALLAAGANYDALSAAHLGDAGQVRALLTAFPGLARDDRLVIAAARNGHTAVLQLLLDHRANPNAVDDDTGLTAIYHALSHPPAVRVLIAAGADCKSRFPRHDPSRFRYSAPELGTPLHHAAADGQIESAKLLLAAGAAVDSRDSDGGGTPLQVAARNGQAGMVQLLIVSKASFNESILVEDMLPSDRTRRAAVIRVLRDAGVPLDLFSAVEIGDAGQVRNLVEVAPQLAFASNGRYTRLIDLAASLGRTEIVAYLLDAGVPIEFRTRSAVDAAARTNQKDVIDLLIRRGADVNWSRNYDCNALHTAALKNAPAAAQLLIRAGANINAKLADGRTALHLAVLANATATLTVLLEAKADPNVPNASGDTPLHVAVARDNLEAVRQLLAAGADVSAKNGDKQTPLGCAEDSDPEIVDLLKKHGAK